MEYTKKIVAVALKLGDKIYTLPPPARHSDLFKLEEKEILARAEQGFLTNEGQFVTRKQAAVIAVRAGQVKSPSIPSCLISEDLW